MHTNDALFLLSIPKQAGRHQDDINGEQHKYHTSFLPMTIQTMLQKICKLKPNGHLKWPRVGKDLRKQL